MDSGSQAAVYGGSGGKILKRRPISARNTPYDRPTPSPQPANPNWLNAIVSPARFVAGGAGRLLSSLWNPEVWASRSESDGSDSDAGGIEDDYEHEESLRDCDVELNQNQGSSSGKSEILYLVEQLLLSERFTREECDRLIRIVNLRVADYTMREGGDAEPNNPNIRNKVIMEARTMITEKLTGSSSDLDYSIHGSEYITTPNRNYLSGGSWSIQNELQRLRSKAVELMKPNKLFFLEAPKPGSETVNTDSKDTTIEEKYQIAEEKDGKTGDDVNRVEWSSDMITEYTEVADGIHASQGSSTNETNSSTVKRAATRTRKYNTRSSGPVADDVINIV